MSNSIESTGLHSPWSRQDLWHHPVHRARRGEFSPVGYSEKRLHRLQSACHAYARGHPEGSGRFSPHHRPGDRVRRSVLSHLSPLGDAGSSRDVLPAIFGVPRREADARSRMPVSERLVSALREAVWPGLTRHDFTRRAACFSESPSVSM